VSIIEANALTTIHYAATQQYRLSPLPLKCMELAAGNFDWRLWNKLGPRQCV